LAASLGGDQGEIAMPSRGVWVLVAVAASATAAGPAGPGRGESAETRRAPPDQCSRAAADRLIGQPLDDAARLLGDRPYGVVTARHKMSGGLIVTGDYRPERLSLVVDRGGRIAQVRCG